MCCGSLRCRSAYEGVKRHHKKLNGHAGLVQGVIHLPGGKRMITCSEDGSLRVWNSKNGSQMGKAWHDSDGESPVNTIALSPNRKTVASGSDDGAVRLWDIQKGTVIVKWMGHSDRVLSLCWNRNGQRVVSGSADGTARVWDVKSGKTIFGPIDTKHETVYTVVYSPDDTMVATGGSGSGGYIKIWDAKEFKLVTTLKGHEWAVHCLAWTADGKTLISGSSDRTIRTWTTTTWKELKVLKHDDEDDDYPIIAITISPNHCILASAMHGFRAELWNIKNNQRIGLPLWHDADAVHCVSFSEDGSSLVTCSGNNAYIWDVSAIVKEAGFNDLLLPSDALQDLARNFVLDAGYASKPINNTSKLPPGFLDGTESRTHASLTKPSIGSSAHRPSSSHPRALSGLSSLFRRSHFLRHHRPDSEQRLHEVDVPHANHKDKYVHAKSSSNQPSPPKGVITMDTSTTRSGVVQQSSDQVYAQQPSSQLQDSITTTYPDVIAGTPSTPGAMKRQAGPQSFFGRFLCF